MRVLITVPWGERLGGAEAMLQTILDSAAGGEHEIELLFLQDGPWPSELRAAGFTVAVAPAGRLREPHRALACIWRISRLLRARRPELIVNWIAKTQLYCAPAALLAGMSGRVVWWQHEIPSDHWMDRAATLLPALAVGCSSQAAAQAQRRLWPRRETFVVAPGTPPPRAEPAGATAAVAAGTPSRDDGGPPVVGMVGRLQPWKGQDRLLAAQALLRERGRELRTLIVGGDAHGLSSRYAASLPELVRELGLQEAAMLTGQVPDAGPYIERMDVLVNASDPEPFGIVLLEAMARAVPVVAVARGGPLEIVDDGLTGALAPSGAPAALAEAIEPLLASAELRRRLGAAGRERYLREFTDVAMRERLFAELERLAAAAR